MLAPLMLLLVLPGADPNDAEQLFRQMEAKVTKAKTLECTYDAKVEADKKGTIKGKLFLGEGNKMWLEMGGEFDGKPGKVTFISDGTKMKAVVEGAPSRPAEDAPKAVGEMVRVMFTRTGVALPFMGTSPPPNKEEFKADEHFRVTDFKLGKKEMIDKQEAQTVQYTLTIKRGNEEKIDVTVWIDTKTQLPLKRVLIVGKADEKMTLTETYTNVKLDGKIDPKQFELPKE